MKIIVASDLHLSPPQSRIGGWDSRRGSYASWLEPNDRLGEIVDYANASGTDAILIGGDMFDSGTPASEAVAMCRDQLNRLSPGIKVVIAEGNHDQRSVFGLHRTPVEAYLGDHPRVHTVAKKYGVIDVDGLRVATLPWVRVGGLSELEEKNLSVEDAIKEMAEEGADLFLGHMMLSDLSICRGSELSMTTEVLETTAPAALLEAGPWQAATIGHVHNRQFVGESGKVNYTGSTYMCSFNEEGQDKGFDVIEFDRHLKIVDRDFVHLHGLRMYTYRYDDRARSRLIEDKTTPGDKVRILCSPDDYDDAAAEASTLSSKGVIVKIVADERERALVSATRQGMSVDMSPSQAMLNYATKKGLDKSRAKRIVDVFEEVISS